MRRLSYLILLISMLYTAVPAHAQRAADRARIVREIEQTDQRSAETVRDWLMEHRVPSRVVRSDGRIVELVSVRDGHPVYLTSLNSTAARVTGTRDLYPGGRLGLSLTGVGIEFGIWDGGHARSDHLELTGRVRAMDGADVSDHATHVAGTLIASGIDSRARGMAYNASLKSYSWTNDATEMSNEATQGMIISNHSYGIVGGWHYGDFEDSGSDRWYWVGDPTISASEDYMFGRYDVDAVQFDRVTYTNPHFLPVVAAGNDRIDTGPRSGTYRALDVNGEYVTYNVEERPIPRDGGQDGFDTIAGAAVAKNVLTVGAVAHNSATNTTYTSSFTSFGPTDDGRVKPDVMGLGEQVYSLSADSREAYAFSSGTSMATPNVAGSLVLLQQYYREVFGTFLRAATLKALVIHTASDLELPGPDYRSGWGLLNVEAAAEQLTSAAMNSSALLEETLLDGESYRREFSVDGEGPVRVTLAWTDHPGVRTGRTASALDDPTLQLQNDLDLRLVHLDSGTEYFPFAPDRLNPGDPAPRGDNAVDPVEQVFVANARPGRYVLRVAHKGALHGGAPQDFSVIVSGADEDGAPVSVAQVSAEATLDGIVLRWSTLFQRPGGHFEIERGPAAAPKSEGPDFTDVGTVALAGSGKQEYEFVDEWTVAGHYQYRIVYVDSISRFVAAETEVALAPPDSYAILSSYPNPFRDQFTLVVDLPRTQQVSVAVYNALGRRMMALPDEDLPAGRHLIRIDGASWPAGAYFAQVKTPNGVAVYSLVRQ